MRAIFYKDGIFYIQTSNTFWNFDDCGNSWLEKSRDHITEYNDVEYEEFIPLEADKINLLNSMNIFLEEDIALHSVNEVYEPVKKCYKLYLRNSSSNYFICALYINGNQHLSPYKYLLNTDTEFGYELYPESYEYKDFDILYYEDMCLQSLKSEWIDFSEKQNKLMSMSEEDIESEKNYIWIAFSKMLIGYSTSTYSTDTDSFYRSVEESSLEDAPDFDFNTDIAFLHKSYSIILQEIGQNLKIRQQEEKDIESLASLKYNSFHDVIIKILMLIRNNNLSIFDSSK